MTEKTLIIAILVALILLWFAETLIHIGKYKMHLHIMQVHSYFLFFVDYGKILCV